MVECGGAKWVAVWPLCCSAATWMVESFSSRGSPFAGRLASVVWSVDVHLPIIGENLGSISRSELL